MTSRMKYAGAWLGLLLITALAVAVVFLPAWLIQPFAPQTQQDLDVSFQLRNWSPIVTLACTVAAILLTVFIWLNTRQWFGKAPVVILILVVVVFTWLARQNHFEWMFNPLRNAAFVEAANADFVTDKEMVLAVNVNGDSVAFPVRQMAYHHVVQDVVGGMPITATY
jgi:hypothetical protein